MRGSGPKNCAISILGRVGVEYKKGYIFVKQKLVAILISFIICNQSSLGLAYADEFTPCSAISVTATSGIGENALVPLGAESHKITIDSKNLPDGDYRLSVHSYIALDAAISPTSEFQTEYKSVSRPNLSFEVSDAAVVGSGIGESDPHQVYLQSAAGGTLCDLGRYHVSLGFPTCTEKINIYQERDSDGDETTEKCYATNNGCLVVNTPVYYELNGVTNGGSTPWEGKLTFNGGAGGSITGLQVSGGSAKGSITFPDPYNSSVVAEDPLLGVNYAGVCTAQPFKVVLHCGPEDCNKTPESEANPTEASSFELCKQIVDSNLQEQCRTCAISGEGGDVGQGGVWTAVGCISRDPVDIARRLIEVGLGMGGGVALLMTLAGGFILSTSQGDPQKANQAKEMITNSVIGLLFVIFSVVILQFIGVTILKIPGFGENTSQVQ